MAALGNSSKFISEWWLQRISAILITAYVFLVLGLLLVKGTPNAMQWQALFAHTGFKLATLFAILATAYHGLVGAMHVWPDYVKNRAVIAVLNDQCGDQNAQAKHCESGSTGCW